MFGNRSDFIANLMRSAFAESVFVVIIYKCPITEHFGVCRGVNYEDSRLRVHDPRVRRPRQVCIPGFIIRIESMVPSYDELQLCVVDDDKRLESLFVEGRATPTGEIATVKH